MTVSDEKFTRQRLLSVQAWSPSLFSLRCSRDPGFRFTTGQFARLGVRKVDGSIVWRAYSMASAAHDEFLEFFSIVVPGGEFTRELSRLVVGDELLVERQPFGFLTLDRFVDELQGARVMICANPQMIDDCRTLLKQRDMHLSLNRRPAQVAVAVENYW
jgi:ferredoxin--NADP+ reductase